MTFQLNVSKSKTGDGMSTSKLRSLMPAIERIRRRTFALNSQEQQRHERLLQHIQLQKKIEEFKFARVKRRLVTDKQGRDIYLRALYNVGKSQLEAESEGKNSGVKLPPLTQTLDKKMVSSTKGTDENGKKVNSQRSKLSQIQEKVLKTNGRHHHKNGTKQGNHDNDNKDGPREDVANVKRPFDIQSQSKKQYDTYVNKLNSETFFKRRIPKRCNLPPYGLYNGRVYHNLGQERNQAFLEVDPATIRKRRSEELLRAAKAESSILIDRSLPTSTLLKNKDAPLQERLRPILRMEPIQVKMKTTKALNKMRHSMNIKYN
ncbi:uncharacterized protein LOC144349979 [Saccoglossus kowalevskii]